MCSCWNCLDPQFYYLSVQLSQDLGKLNCKQICSQRQYEGLLSIINADSICYSNLKNLNNPFRAEGLLGIQGRIFA